MEGEAERGKGGERGGGEGGGGLSERESEMWGMGYLLLYMTSAQIDIWNLRVP